jgi:hypothetical protein
MSTLKSATASAPASGFWGGVSSSRGHRSFSTENRRLSAQAATTTPRCVHHCQPTLPGGAGNLDRMCLSRCGDKSISEAENRLSRMLLSALRLGTAAEINHRWMLRKELGSSRKGR